MRSRKLWQSVTTGGVALFAATTLAGGALATDDAPATSEQVAVAECEDGGTGTDEPIEDAADEPATEPAAEPADEPAAEPVDEPVEEGQECEEAPAEEEPPVEPEPPAEEEPPLEEEPPVEPPAEEEPPVEPEAPAEEEPPAVQEPVAEPAPATAESPSTGSSDSGDSEDKGQRATSQPEPRVGSTPQAAPAVPARSNSAALLDELLKSPSQGGITLASSISGTAPQFGLIGDDARQQTAGSAMATGRADALPQRQSGVMSGLNLLAVSALAMVMALLTRVVFSGTRRRRTS